MRRRISRHDAGTENAPPHKNAMVVSRNLHPKQKFSYASGNQVDLKAKAEVLRRQNPVPPHHFLRRPGSGSSSKSASAYGQNPTQNSSKSTHTGMIPPPGSSSSGISSGTRLSRQSSTKDNLVKLVSDPAFDGKGRMEFYDLLSLQGQGAFGKVWKARHRLTGHLVAIKIYEPIKMKEQSSKVLLINEMKAMKRVSHKHSMQFLESFQHHNKLHLVLEYIPGGSLKSRLRRSKTRRLDEIEAKTIFAQLVLAVSEMHRQAVVHRDIKIENILFDTEGNVRLIDFGLSACGKLNTGSIACDNQQDTDPTPQRARSETIDGTKIDNPHHVSTYDMRHKGARRAEPDCNSNSFRGHHGQNQSTFSRANLHSNKSTPSIPSPVHKECNGSHFKTVPTKEKPRKPPVPKPKVADVPREHSINLKRFAGTPLYMAPEVLDRKGYNGRPVDVWSIGVLLYLVLCGRFPFKDVSTVDDLKHIVKQGFPQPPKHLQLSDDVLDLLRRLLCVSPTKRFKIDEVLGHRWLREAVEEQERMFATSSTHCSHPVTMTKVGKHGLGLNETVVRDALKNKAFNHFSTCYHLIRLNAEKAIR